MSYRPHPGLFYFLTAQNCTHGSHVTWIPRSAARLVKAAYASDGLAAAVVLQPTGHPAAFRLVVTRNGRLVGSVTVQPGP